MAQHAQSLIEISGRIAPDEGGSSRPPMHKQLLYAMENRRGKLIDGPRRLYFVEEHLDVDFLVAPPALSMLSVAACVHDFAGYVR
jgi:hypothetical protein